MLILVQNGVQYVNSTKWLRIGAFLLLLYITIHTYPHPRTTLILTPTQNYMYIRIGS